MKTRLIQIAVSLLVALAGAAWSTEPPASALAAPAFESAPCQFAEADDDWVRDSDASCGWVSVPARRDQEGESDDRLRLWVVKLPALRDSDLPPVIRVLGGPEPIRFAYVTGARTTRFRERHDAVFFDYRGLGRSEPVLSCRVEPVTGATAEDRLASKLHQYATCRAQLDASGVDLHAISSRENARDIDDIARALGYERYYTSGGSYGSITTLELMRAHPDGLRAVVIGTPLPPNSPLHDTVGSFALALAKVQDSCNRTRPCAERYPDLAGTLAKAMDRLDRTPLYHEGRRLFPADLFASLWYLAALDSYLWVPSAIDFAAHGDAGTLARWIGENSAGWDFFLPEPTDATSIVAATVSCQDIAKGSAIAVDMRAAAERHPYLARVVAPADAFDRLCAAWRPAPVPAGAGAAVASDLPVLFYSLFFDPVTPPEDTRLAAETLPNAIVLEHPGGTHVSLTADPCLIDMEAAFLADPGGAFDRSCTAGWTPAEFVLDTFDRHLASSAPSP